MDRHKFDIAVIGGGLAGLTQAIALARQGWNVACIDREQPEVQTQTAYDIRTTAISWGSRNLLLNLDIWQELEGISQPITHILIKDEDNPRALDFNIEDVDGDAFGWIVDNRDLRLQLLKAIKAHKNIAHITGDAVTAFTDCDTHIDIQTATGKTLSARLVIGADGRNSFTREAMAIGTWHRDYGQHAIVTMITHKKPHNGTAVEHFRAQGPFAALPYTDDADGRHRSAIVWTVDSKDAQNWLDCSDDVITAAIQERLGDLFGTLEVCGARGAWPLSLTKAYSYIKPRMALVAEAAHGIHPIAGQGLNMSLRDVAAMAEVLNGATDPGDMALLSRYQKMRRGDNLQMVLATDTLNDLFGYTNPVIRAARRFGLQAVSTIKPAKQFFMTQAMGALGHLPALVRERR